MKNGWAVFCSAVKSENLFTLVIGVTGFLISVQGCTFKNKKDIPGTYHYPVIDKVKGMDPAMSDDLYSNREVGKGYEALYQYHYLKRPYELIPNLAQSMPEISPDGLIYTIKIKKGVLFHDDPSFTETNGKGRELKITDFIYSFKRLADPKISSPGWWIFDGKIVGLNEWREKASKSGSADYSVNVEGLKQLDPYTLQIKLNKKSYQLVYGLAMPFASAVAQEAVQKYGPEFINHVVGTGPFILQEFNPASRIVWLRNKNYRQEFYPSEGAKGDLEAGLLKDAGKPLPLAQKIVMDIIVEAQPRWLNFLSGALDYVEIPKDSFAQAISLSKDLTPELVTKGIQLNKWVRTDITHESFNMADPLIGKNKFLRQAISLSLNTDVWVELFYNGRAIQAQGPIPPGITGYDPLLKNPYRQYNLQKAKELMVKAGYPEGKGLPVLRYLSGSSTTLRQMSEYLAKGMSEIGVKVKVESYSWPEFQAALKAGKGQIYGHAWNADYPDAENFFQLFYSKNHAPGPNDSFYSSAVFDKIFEKSLGLPDSLERTALYHQLVQVLIEDCPWVFGVHRIGYVLNQGRLKNVKPHDFEHNEFKYYRPEDLVTK